MDSLELSNVTALPVQVVGRGFHFGPGTGKAVELDMFEAIKTAVAAA